MDFFKEFLADIPDSGFSEDKLCDIYVQRIFENPEDTRRFKWGVSIMRFTGDTLEEAKTLATFNNYKLALDFAKKVKEVFKGKGYETYLKGEIDE